MQTIVENFGKFLKAFWSIFDSDLTCTDIYLYRAVPNNLVSSTNTGMILHVSELKQVDVQSIEQHHFLVH